MVIPKNDWQLLFLSAVFLFVALLPSINYPKLPLFIISGVFSGWFYGKHNNEVWQPSSNTKLYEEVHNYWTHFFGGVIAGISLFFLSSRINFYDASGTVSKLAGVDFVLFLIMVLGYTGYIPRMLWILASTGKLIEKLFK